MIIDYRNTFNGDDLNRKFITKHFVKNHQVLPLGNIICLNGPIDIKDNDEDYKREQVLSFLWTNPLVKDEYSTILFHRYFITGIAQILNKYLQTSIEIDQENIIIHKEHQEHGIIQPKGIVNVSVVKTTGVGYLGINIKAGKYSQANSFSTNFPIDISRKLADDVINFFYKIGEELCEKSLIL